MKLRDYTKQVFLSHTRKEGQLAEAVTRLLESEGCSVWYDREIRPGLEWETEIRKALENSDSMIAILSPHAYSSSWVREELKYALFEERFNNKFLPVLIGEESIDGFNRLPWILTKLQFLKISPKDSHDKNAKRIIESFKKLMKREEAPR
jgi:hypothetical protein